MSTAVVEQPPIAADVLIREIESPHDRSIYVPGAGGERVWHLSAGASIEELGGLNMRKLAWLGAHPDHPLLEQIEVECGKPLWRATKGEGYERTGHHCTARFFCARMWAPLTACDECREAAEERKLMDDARSYWLKICRPSYRDTDPTHPAFPVVQRALVGEWAGETSLFFYGPKRTGKTRLALFMAKKALLRGKTVGVLYSDVLDRINPQSFTENPVEVWGRFDVLVLDDALITAKTPKLASFLKHLIGYIMEHNRRVIITSQVGGDDYVEHIRKGGEASRVDTDTAEALIGRIREMCPAGSAQVSFAGALPKKEEQEEAF